MITDTALSAYVWPHFGELIRHEGGNYFCSTRELQLASPFFLFVHRPGSTLLFLGLTEVRIFALESSRWELKKENVKSPSRQTCNLLKSFISIQADLRGNLYRLPQSHRPFGNQPSQAGTNACNQIFTTLQIHLFIRIGDVKSQSKPTGKQR